jgi:hypothetical protein
MKLAKYITTLLIALLVGGVSVYAQTADDLQYFKDPGKEGINVFETPKENTVEYDGMVIKVGGDFALQFQGISQDNFDNTLLANDLANNFNLPTANLNLDVQLEDGLRMHLRTYLSSRHHAEAYVKGGYMQVDKLDFISEGLASGLMENLTIRVGMDEFNYGDAHFRRSDNAAALYNPFVGNYLMDSFSTEPFMEFTYQNSGFIGVLGATNGRLNQSPTDGDNGFVLFGKLGYDTQVNEDLRVRLTGSFYNSSEESTRDYIYGGDRAGSRYYAIMGGGDFDGRINPRFGTHTAFQINPFLKFQGLEFFGIYEVSSNNDDAGGSFTQLGGELLYRFGMDESFYIGGRYNTVSGETSDVAATQEANRINVGAGWFMTNNVLTKLEYVSQKYENDGWNTTVYQDGEFSGIMLEAVISF